LNPKPFSLVSSEKADNQISYPLFFYHQ